MRSYIVLDSGFLVATIDSTDEFHSDAVFLFREFVARKDTIQILIPPLVMYEVIVTLRRKGVSGTNIETILMRFVNLPYVSILSLSEMSAFKHATHSLNNRDPSKALRTHDFLIFCLGNEFGGLIVTFDMGMHTKCKAIYKDIYFPAERPRKSDDTASILLSLDNDAGVDITKASYSPFKAHRV